MTIAPDAAIVAAPQQISCDLSGEAVILNLQTGVYYGLNPVGARVWELVQTPRTIPEIRDFLVNEYAVDPDSCERDLRSLLDELVARKLIQIDGAAGKVSQTSEQ